MNVEEKDLDIDVKEVDTKGILGLLEAKNTDNSQNQGAVGAVILPQKTLQPLMTLPKNMAKNSSLNWQPLPD